MNGGHGVFVALNVFLQRPIEALNAGDTESLLAVVAPDIVIHYAEMPEPLQDARPGNRASSS